MADDPKPDPLEDVRRGLGLLLRAARTAIERLPTKDFERTVTSSAKQVGRVLETVGKTIEHDVLGRKDSAPSRDDPKEDPGNEPGAAALPTPLGNNEPRKPEDNP